MAITYKKLRNIISEREIQMKTLEIETGISHTTLAKINKDEYIHLETLEILARHLKVEIGDIISLKR